MSERRLFPTSSRKTEYLSPRLNSVLLRLTITFAAKKVMGKGVERSVGKSDLM